MSKTPSARAERPAHPDDPTPEAGMRCWGFVYENFEDGPGGGFVLREIVVPLSLVELHTVRTWPAELLSVGLARMAGRASAFAADGESAEAGTYG